MKVGTLLMNTRTGGIGEIQAVRMTGMDFTLDGIVYNVNKEYHLYGRRTNREMWIREDGIQSFIRRGILVEWPDELKPKEYIPRYDFQKR